MPPLSEKDFANVEKLFNAIQCLLELSREHRPQTSKSAPPVSATSSAAGAPPLISPSSELLEHRHLRTSASTTDATVISPAVAARLTTSCRQASRRRIWAEFAFQMWRIAEVQKLNLLAYVTNEPAAILLELAQLLLCFLEEQCSTTASSSGGASLSKAERVLRIALLGQDRLFFLLRVFCSLKSCIVMLSSTNDGKADAGHQLFSSICACVVAGHHLTWMSQVYVCFCDEAARCSLSRESLPSALVYATHDVLRCLQECCSVEVACAMEFLNTEPVPCVTYMFYGLKLRISSLDLLRPCEDDRTLKDGEERSEAAAEQEADPQVPPRDALVSIPKAVAPVCPAGTRGFKSRYFSMSTPIGRSTAMTASLAALQSSHQPPVDSEGVRYSSSWALDIPDLSREQMKQLLFFGRTNSFDVLQLCALDAVVESVRLTQEYTHWAVLSTAANIFSLSRRALQPMLPASSDATTLSDAHSALATMSMPMSHIAAMYENIVVVFQLLLALIFTLQRPSKDPCASPTANTPSTASAPMTSSPSPNPAGALAVRRPSPAHLPRQGNSETANLPETGGQALAGPTRRDAVHHEGENQRSDRELLQQQREVFIQEVMKITFQTDLHEIVSATDFLLQCDRKLFRVLQSLCLMGRNPRKPTNAPVFNATMSTGATTSAAASPPSLLGGSGNTFQPINTSASFFVTSTFGDLRTLTSLNHPAAGARSTPLNYSTIHEASLRSNPSLAGHSTTVLTTTAITASHPESQHGSVAAGSPPTSSLYALPPLPHPDQRSRGQNFAKSFFKSFFTGRRGGHSAGGLRQSLSDAADSEDSGDAGCNDMDSESDSRRDAGSGTSPFGSGSMAMSMCGRGSGRQVQLPFSWREIPSYTAFVGELVRMLNSVFADTALSIDVRLGAGLLLPAIVLQDLDAFDLYEGRVVLRNFLQIFLGELQCQLKVDGGPGLTSPRSPEVSHSPLKDGAAVDSDGKASVSTSVSLEGRVSVPVPLWQRRRGHLTQNELSIFTLRVVESFEQAWKVLGVPPLTSEAIMLTELPLYFFSIDTTASLGIALEACFTRIMVLWLIALVGADCDEDMDRRSVEVLFKLLDSALRRGSLPKDSSMTLMVATPGSATMVNTSANAVRRSRGAMAVTLDCHSNNSRDPRSLPLSPARPAGTTADLTDLDADGDPALHRSLLNNVLFDTSDLVNLATATEVPINECSNTVDALSIVFRTVVHRSPTLLGREGLATVLRLFTSHDSNLSRLGKECMIHSLDVPETYLAYSDIIQDSDSALLTQMLAVISAYLTSPNLNPSALRERRVWLLRYGCVDAAIKVLSRVLDTPYSIPNFMKMIPHLFRFFSAFESGSQKPPQLASTNLVAIVAERLAKLEGTEYFITVAQAVFDAAMGSYGGLDAGFTLIGVPGTHFSDICVVGSFRVAQHNCAAEKPFFLEMVPSLLSYAKRCDAELYNNLIEVLFRILQCTGNVRSDRLADFILRNSLSQMLPFLEVSGRFVDERLPFTGSAEALQQFWQPVLLHSPRRSEIRLVSHGGVQIRVGMWPSKGFTISAWFYFDRLYSTIPFFEFIGTGAASGKLNAASAATPANAMPFTASLYVSGGDSLQLSTGDGRRITLNESQALQNFKPMRWLHICAVLNTQHSIEVYLNGFRVGTVPLMYYAAESEVQVNVGCTDMPQRVTTLSADASPLFSIGDIVLWSNALKRPQVEAEMASSELQIDKQKVQDEEVPRELSRWARGDVNTTRSHGLSPGGVGPSNAFTQAMSTVTSQLLNGAPFEESKHPVNLSCIPIAHRIARFIPYENEDDVLQNALGGSIEVPVVARVVGRHATLPKTWVDFPLLWATRGGILRMVDWLHRVKTSLQLEEVLQLLSRCIRRTTLAATLDPRTYLLLCYMLKHHVAQLMTTTACDHLLRLATSFVVVMNEEHRVIINRLALHFIFADAGLYVAMHQDVALYLLQHVEGLFNVARCRYARHNALFSAPLYLIDRLLNSTVCHAVYMTHPLERAIVQTAKQVMVATDMDEVLVHTFASLVAQLTFEESVTSSRRNPHIRVVLPRIEMTHGVGKVPFRVLDHLTVTLLYSLVECCTHGSFLHALSHTIDLSWYATCLSRFSNPAAVVCATRLFFEAAQHSRSLHEELTKHQSVVVEILAAHAAQEELMLLLLAITFGAVKHIDILSRKHSLLQQLDSVMGSFTAEPDVCVAPIFLKIFSLHIQSIMRATPHQRFIMKYRASARPGRRIPYAVQRVLSLVRVCCRIMLRINHARYGQRPPSPPKLEAGSRFYERSMLAPYLSSRSSSQSRCNSMVVGERSPARSLQNSFSSRRLVTGGADVEDSDALHDAVETPAANEMSEDDAPQWKPPVLLPDYFYGERPGGEKATPMPDGTGASTTTRDDNDSSAKEKMPFNLVRVANPLDAGGPDTASLTPDNRAASPPPPASDEVPAIIITRQTGGSIFAAEPNILTIVPRIRSSKRPRPFAALRTCVLLWISLQVGRYRRISKQSEIVSPDGTLGDKHAGTLFCIRTMRNLASTSSYFNHFVSSPLQIAALSSLVPFLSNDMLPPDEDAWDTMVRSIIPMPMKENDPNSPSVPTVIASIQSPKPGLTEGTPEVARDAQTLNTATFSPVTSDPHSIHQSSPASSSSSTTDAPLSSPPEVPPEAGSSSSITALPLPDEASRTLHENCIGMHNSNSLSQLDRTAILESQQPSFMLQEEDADFLETQPMRLASETHSFDSEGPEHTVTTQIPKRRLTASPAPTQPTLSLPHDLGAPPDPPPEHDSSDADSTISSSSSLTSLNASQRSESSLSNIHITAVATSGAPLSTGATSQTTSGTGSINSAPFLTPRNISPANRIIDEARREICSCTVTFLQSLILSSLKSLPVPHWVGGPTYGCCGGLLFQVLVLVSASATADDSAPALIRYFLFTVGNAVKDQRDRSLYGLDGATTAADGVSPVFDGERRGASATAPSSVASPLVVPGIRASHLGETVPAFENSEGVAGPLSPGQGGGGAATTMSVVGSLAGGASRSSASTYTDVFLFNVSHFTELIVDMLAINVLELPTATHYFSTLLMFCQGGWPMRYVDQLSWQVMRACIAVLNRPSVQDASVGLIESIYSLSTLVMRRGWKHKGAMESLIRVLYRVYISLPPAWMTEQDARRRRRLVVLILRHLVQTYAGTKELEKALTTRTLTQRLSLCSDFCMIFAMENVEESCQTFEQYCIEQSAQLETLMAGTLKTKADLAFKASIKTRGDYIKRIKAFNAQFIQASEVPDRYRPASLRLAFTGRFSSYVACLPKVEGTQLHWLLPLTCSLRPRVVNTSEEISICSTPDQAVAEKGKEDATKNSNSSETGGVLYHFLDPHHNYGKMEAVQWNTQNKSQTRGSSDKDQDAESPPLNDLVLASLCEEQVQHVATLLPPFATRCRPNIGEDRSAILCKDLTLTLSPSAMTLLRYLVRPNEVLRFLSNGFRIRGIHATPCLILLTNTTLKVIAFSRVTETGDIILCDFDNNDEEDSQTDEVESEPSVAVNPLKQQQRFSGMNPFSISAVTRHLQKLLPENSLKRRQESDGTRVALSVRQTTGRDYESVYWTYPVKSIRSVRCLRYMHLDTAVQLHLYHDNGPMLSVVDAKQSMNPSARKGFLKVLKDLLQSQNCTFVDDSQRGMAMRSHLVRWAAGSLSNYDYLCFLNDAAGRTTCDLNQYPIFPWVLANYSSAILDLEKASTFRQFCYPMGAQTEQRRNAVTTFYENTKEICSGDDNRSYPFHHGTHYSTSGGVLYYLIRVEPFTTYARIFQGGEFDLAMRLFDSISATYSSCVNGPADCKELTPEFYSTGSFLRNADHLALGTRSDGVPVDHVHLPPWAKGSTQVFTAVMRYALESHFVVDQLHLWIDLIFGARRRGPSAVERLNVFQRMTYGEEVAKALMEAASPHDTDVIIAEVDNFGQTPPQLFQERHPAHQELMPIVAQPANSRALGGRAGSQDTSPKSGVYASTLFPMSIHLFTGGLGESSSSVNNNNSSSGGGGGGLSSRPHAGSGHSNLISPGSFASGATYTQAFRREAPKIVQLLVNSMDYTQTWLSLQEPNPQMLAPCPANLISSFGNDAPCVRGFATLQSGKVACCYPRIVAIPDAEMYFCWHECEARLMRFMTGNRGVYCSVLTFDPPDDVGFRITAVAVSPRETAVLIAVSSGAVYCLFPDDDGGDALYARSTLCHHRHPIVRIVLDPISSRAATFTSNGQDFPAVWRVQRGGCSFLFRLDLAAALPSLPDDSEAATDTARVVVDMAFSSIADLTYVATSRSLLIFDCNGDPYGAGTLPSSSRKSSLPSSLILLEDENGDIGVPVDHPKTIVADMSAVAPFETKEWAAGMAVVLSGHRDGSLALWRVTRLPPDTVKPGKIAVVEFHTKLFAAPMGTPPVANLNPMSTPLPAGASKSPPTSSGGGMLASGAVTSIRQERVDMPLFWIGFENGEVRQLVFEDPPSTGGVGGSTTKKDANCSTSASTAGGDKYLKR